MYVPAYFAMRDRAEMLAFLRAHPFGMIVSAAGGVPVATHVPFIVTREEPLTLGLHVAKANPQWEALEGADVLAIFPGPHAFVSAAWYDRPADNVPTWNYGSVHCNGRARLADDAAADALLRELSSEFEGGAWRIEDADADYVGRLKRAIVAIEIDVTSITGAKKFSQNHSASEIARIIEEFEKRAPDLAAEMRAHYGV